MIYEREALEKIYQGPTEKIPWDLGKPYRQLTEFVRKNKQCSALDVGCGTGTDAIFLAQNGFDVTGIDISKAAIKRAEKKAEQSGVEVKFIVGDVFNIPFEDESFEFVNDNGCFHLLDKRRWRRFLAEVHRVMKMGGKYLLKCFSDKEPPNSKIPYRLSEKEIRKYFSNLFDIQYIKSVKIGGKHGNHQGHSCLMIKKQKNSLS